VYRNGIVLFGVAFVVLGVLITVRTVFVAGASFGVGYVLGPMFVALGLARLYLVFRRR
jgi:hypothetical protein